jgi:16S rRNA (cytosine967-C5)-methyltransferase
VPDLGRFASQFGFGVRLTPLTSGTDGFFIAMLVRS